MTFKQIVSCSQHLKPIGDMKMELMQGYAKNDGVVGMENLHRWTSTLVFKAYWVDRISYIGEAEHDLEAHWSHIIIPEPLEQLLDLIQRQLGEM